MQINSQGRSIYVTPNTPEIANNTNIGTQYASAFHDVLQPTGAFSAEDSTAMQKVATTAGNPDFLSKLDGYVANNDLKRICSGKLGKSVAPAAMTSNTRG